jgi:hypothetical protein
MSDLVKAGTQALEAYIAAGDIERLDSGQRIALYRAVCDSLGLNPLTQPFQYLRLSGKTVLYATKSCTEQLRQIHGVSVTSMQKEVFGEILVVTVAVRERGGREDIATGSVCLKGLGGENLSNAYMKAETKAKRRATLSICGLAVLDESETDSIAGAERRSVDDLHGRQETAQAAAPAPSEPKAKAKRGGKHEAPAAAPAALPEAVEAEVVAAEPRRLLIHPDAGISVVANAAGRKVWRIDQDGIDRPLAILDEKLAGMVEAVGAFGGICSVAVEERGGKLIVTSVEEDRDA